MNIIKKVQKLIEKEGLKHCSSKEIEENDLFHEDFINIGDRYYHKDEIEALFNVDFRCRL